MKSLIIESQYPIVFREHLAKELGQHLKTRQSVVLIGMKRVGISNFLRFFIYHKDIAKTYIKDSKKHLFIPVDLNDLVELEIFPFWTLTFKRIVDSVEKSNLKKEIKNKIQTLFLNSIQSQDLFLTIDSIRRSLVMLIENGALPTLFFIRFDRLKNVATAEFFANLQGLKDATHQKLSYVFTSFRSLDVLSPVFKKATLSVFSKDLYIKPAGEKDIEIIFETYQEHYRLGLSLILKKGLFEIVDGYVQYLQLALISLSENKILPKEKKALFESLVKDERIILQSEELWESLNEDDKNVLLRIVKGEKPTKKEKEKAKYLWGTGFVKDEKGNSSLFSPLLTYYIEKEIDQTTNHMVEFTKKENLLFTFLKENIDKICEREQIIEAVWPEVKELGVSDWAIDRLVARVRNKLKLQKSQFEIQTIKTRGYKLAEIKI